MAKRIIHMPTEPWNRVYWKNGTGSAVSAKNLAPMATGDVMVCPLVDVANAAFGAAIIRGVIEYDKESGQAWTQGAAIYFDSGNNRLTTTTAGNKRAGIAFEDAASAATVGKIILNHELGNPGT